MAAKRGKGRPRKTLTKEQVKQVESLVGYGLTIGQVAAYFGVSDRTLQRQAREDSEVAKAVAAGKAKALALVGQSLFEAATKTKNVAAMIFYLKTRGDGAWREKSELEVEFKPVRVFRTTVQTDGSLLQQIIEEDRAKAAKELASEDADVVDVE